MTLAMMRRLVWVGLIGLSVQACGEDTATVPPAPRSVEVELKPSQDAPKPELALEIEVSSEEIDGYKKAATAITQKNAEAEAAALLAEIEADIASGDDEIPK